MTKMTRIFIVEDELVICEKMIILLESLEHKVVGTCDNADNALGLIERAEPNLVLIDIALPGKNNGISLASQIHEKLQLPHIFITSFLDKETIAEALGSDPVTYLTKPVKKADLEAAIQLALTKKDVKPQKDNSCEHRSLFVKVGDKLKKINTSEILWIEASETNYCDLVFHNYRQLSVRNTIQGILEQLSTLKFTQVHRKYIVNLDAITAINTKEFTIYIKEKKIPVSRRMKGAFLERINRL